MKKILFAAAFAVAAMTAGARAETVKIGVTPGPHAQVLEKVKEVAAARGLDIEILEFSDYVVPNQALADGELNANIFQHKPYLDNQVADRGFNIVDVAYTINFPMGVYSGKVKNLDELPEGATVAIPNDPTNGGRALLLLAANGLIELKEGTGLKAGPTDVSGNPKKLAFVELDAAQLPRSLQDVDIAVINTNYALEAGIDPSKDAIAREAGDAPYANLIAVNAGDKDAPWVRTLVESYHNDTIKKFIADTFMGAVEPAW